MAENSTKINLLIENIFLSHLNCAIKQEKTVVRV